MIWGKREGFKYKVRKPSKCECKDCSFNLGACYILHKREEEERLQGFFCVSFVHTTKMRVRETTENRRQYDDTKLPTKKKETTPLPAENGGRIKKSKKRACWLKKLS